MDLPLLLINEDATKVDVDLPSLGKLGGVCQKRPHGSGQNQDSCAVLPTKNGLVLAVADGVGGGPEGEVASRIAIEHLSERLKNGSTSVRDSILDAFESANRALVERATGAATTLSVVELEVKSEGVLFRPYHAGDSSIVVCGGRGRVKLSTLNHSPVGYAVEAGLLPAEEALHHSDLNLVSNLVGMSDMRIDLGVPSLLAPLDTIVVGSDGLFDNLHLEEIVAIVRKGPVSGVAARLARLADERMQGGGDAVPSKPDDLAFLVYRGPRRR